jgi:protoporphyrinogen/coproporphyrinogen III oxidase
VGARGRAVVVGGGVAGLTWALDALEAGYAVTLLEATARLGGVVRSGPLGAVRVDVGAESFALTRPDVVELARRLELTDDIVRPVSHQAHVLTGGRLLPLPSGLLGIPASLEDITRLLGSEVAAEAARRDAEPVAPSGPATIGALVRARLGDRVSDTLVDPVLAGVHATRADDAELSSVAPSLYEAVRTHGGLLPAVRALRGVLGPAGSPVASFHGGMDRLVERLQERLRAGGALVRTATPVTAVRFDGGWTVHGADGAHAADVLCLAVPARAASRLLGEGDGAVGMEGAEGLARELAALPTTDDVVLVTLLLEDAALAQAGAPVGSGVLVADGSVLAKAMTHASAKWGWLAESLPADHHVVRLSYGGTDEGCVRSDGEDTTLVAQALADVQVLLAGAIGAAQVRASLVTRWDGALSRPVVGRTQRLVGIDDRIAALDGLAVTGSAVAGNGLAGVVGRSRAEAARTL